MKSRSFCIVFSNYTAQVFAWEGTPRVNRKFLGSRQIIATVKATSGDEALAAWQSTRPALG